MTWLAHVALILLLTATGPDSLLVAALALLVARVAWALLPEVMTAAIITTTCPVGDEIECPNCGGLGTDRPGTFSSYDLYVDHLCHVCQGEQIVMCICDEGPDPDCVVCTHA